MEPKKSKKANLENKRSLFFQAGLIVTLGLTLAAFEWKTSAKKIVISETSLNRFDDIEQIVNTDYKEEKPKPPKPLAPEIITIAEEGYDDVFADIRDFIWEVQEYDVIYPVEEKDPVTVRIAEQMPKYHGGNEIEFWKDMNKKLRYPALAQEMNLEGTVFVDFVVDKKGEITNIKIVRSDDPIFNQEVIRALKQSDKWTPGRQLDKAVNVAFTMKFSFKLEY